MIDELEERLATFSGAPNRTRCFAHVVNLIAQTIIRQFDVPKAKEGGVADEAAKGLQKLAEDIDIEELLTRANTTYNNSDNEDDLDGWIDEKRALSPSDLEGLEVSVQPVRRTLVKVGTPCQRVVVVRTNSYAALSSEKLRMQSRTPRQLWAPNGF